MKNWCRLIGLPAMLPSLFRGSEVVIGEVITIKTGEHMLAMEAVICPHCQGKGAIILFTSAEVCAQCDGHKWYYQVSRNGV